MSQTSLVTETLAKRIEDALVVSVMEQPKRPGPVWALPLNDDEVALVAAALRSFHHAQTPADETLWKAYEAFEFIRLKLINHLNEPERSAFWRAVQARNDVGNFIAAHVPTVSDTSTNRRSTPSCGCVFCDLSIPLHHDEVTGFHHVDQDGETVSCTVSSPDRCQVCGEPADLTCGPSRFGDKTWACKDCWEPDTRPDRKADQ